MKSTNPDEVTLKEFVEELKGRPFKKYKNIFIIGEVKK